MTESWARAASFLGDVVLTGETAWANVAGTHLEVLASLRPRWAGVLEVHVSMGPALVFAVPGETCTQWVRLEPRHPGLDLFAVSLFTSRPFPPSRTRSGRVVSGDVCRVGSVPTVLESFLLQLAEPSGPLPVPPPPVGGRRR